MKRTKVQRFSLPIILLTLAFLNSLAAAYVLGVARTKASESVGRELARAQTITATSLTSLALAIALAVIGLILLKKELRQTN